MPHRPFDGRRIGLSANRVHFVGYSEVEAPRESSIDGLPLTPQSIIATAHGPHLAKADYTAR